MSRLAFLLVGLLALALLAGCDSPRESYCSSWGYEPSTPAYDRCLKHLDRRADIRRREALQRLERTRIHPEW